ncbi:MAG: choline ABC transporter substrate-binding protein [Pseudomonas sp.]|uniref:choline ABC transporter substrate-binding protein n=1 Tax=Pseudomonas sp. TaxID=306 RepID=UPI003394A741
MKGITSFCLTLCLSTPLLATAAEPDSCKLVRFGDIGWADIAVTNAVTRFLLSSLGYTTQATQRTSQETYAALKDNTLDVFLGNWVPAGSQPSPDGSRSETLRANLLGAKYTLAVPDYVYDAGLHSFADIAKYSTELNGEIQGIHPGSGNKRIAKMIAENTFGLGKFKLIESNEKHMLANVGRAMHLKQWRVFLGWEPHPMNTRMKLRYLEGGDDIFGPEYGSSTVYTNTRVGYAKECSNVGQLLQNLEFSLEMENVLMDAVQNQQETPRRAAKAWLKTHPQVLDAWLAGVKTRDGQPGLDAVKASLGLQ